MNPVDVTRQSSLLVGATDMVPIAANAVVIVSPASHHVVIAEHPLHENLLVLNKSRWASLPPRSVSYFGGKVFVTMDGGYQTFAANDLGPAGGVVPDAWIYGRIQATVDALYHLRRNPAEVVKRSVSTGVVEARVPLAYNPSRLVMCDGYLLCISEGRAEVIELARFIKYDEFPLPHGTSIRDAMYRDGWLIYVTPTHIVHFNLYESRIEFSHHDFFAEYKGISRVDAIDFGMRDNPVNDGWYPHLQTPAVGGLHVNIRAVTGPVIGVLRAGTPQFSHYNTGGLPTGRYRITYDASRSSVMCSLDGGATWGISGGAGAPGIRFGLEGTNQNTWVPFPGLGFFSTVAEAIAAYNDPAQYVELDISASDRIGFAAFDTDFSDNITTEDGQQLPFTLTPVPFLVGGRPIPEGRSRLPLDSEDDIQYAATNLDQNTDVTEADIEHEDQTRMRGALSHAFRSAETAPTIMGAVFGELYAGDQPPPESVFKAIGPTGLIRSVGNSYAFCDPSRGVIGFTGSLLFRYAWDSLDINSGSEQARGLDVEWTSHEGSTVDAYMSMSREGYPSVPVIWLPGRDGKWFGQGRNWKTKFVGGAITVVAWIKPERNETRVQRIVSTKKTWFDPQGSFDLVYRPRSADGLNGPYIELFGSGGTPGGYWVRSMEPTPELDDGEWHCIIGVLGADTGRIYIDGVNRTGYSFAAPVIPNDCPLVIGKIAGQGVDGSPDYYHGFIGEIRIYGESFTEAQVANTYSRSRDFYQDESFVPGPFIPPLPPPTPLTSCQYYLEVRGDDPFSWGMLSVNLLTCGPSMGPSDTTWVWVEGMYGVGAWTRTIDTGVACVGEGDCLPYDDIANNWVECGFPETPAPFPAAPGPPD